MIFTSYAYVVFLLTAFVIHWSLPPAWRKPFLVAASYVFYCSWKWPFGFLLLGVSLFNWSYGRYVVARSDSARPLALGILVNLTPLIYFKYTNFLVTNVAGLAGIFGSGWHPRALDIILPLGISFFTFQGIAYLIDVASGDRPFERPLDFLLYKGFWPQLIAGPIIRPGEIREQILGERVVSAEDVSFGCRRILFGFFKKVCLADTLAPYVDAVYLAGPAPHAVDAAVATLGFGLQIYFDFSAYSDIAIGTARLFGFRFPENFEWPYSARSPQEFWSRWHMTLSRWIRDYVFTPMTFAARRYPKSVPVWLIVAMAACGLWHGAQWTFVVWGLWHGGLLAVGEARNRARAGMSAASPGRIPAAAGTIVTMGLVMLGWVFFRAQSMAHALGLFRTMFTLEGGLRPAVLRENGVLIVVAIFAGLLLAQTLRGLASRWRTVLAAEARWAAAARGLGYALLAVLIIVMDHEAQAFVYFQF